MTFRVKQKAFHDLRLSDGTLVAGPVSVTFDADDHPVSWHLLTAEEPFTEWVGGLYVVTKR